MPTFRILRGATAYNVSNGQPIYIESIDDLGGAGVRNFEEQGPYQDGVSHLDYRLEPSIVTLRLFVKAATGALLDAQRDILNAMFKPVRGVPITLEVTRDDGEVRLLDTERFGRLGIRLQPGDNAGKLHRAVVQLRAGDPTWYNATEQEVVFSGSDITWWTGFGTTIGTANVIEHVESPSQGQLWINAAAIASGSAWSIFFRSGSVLYNGSLSEYVFGMTPAGSGPEFETVSGGHFARASAAHAVGPAEYMSVGTANYLLTTNGGTLTLYRNMVSIATDTTGGTTAGIPAASPGSARWRSDRSNNASSRWPLEIPYAAAYNIELDATQRAALQAATQGSAYSISIPYDGDYDSHPVIEIHGPITSPIITNTATGDVLNFTGGTVGGADVWTIDTRYGRKSVLNAAGSSVAQYLSEDSDLATFRIAADPTAAGGTNIIAVQGSVVGTATAVEIAWFNRFLDY